MLLSSDVQFISTRNFALSEIADCSVCSFIPLLITVKIRSFLNEYFQTQGFDGPQEKKKSNFGTLEINGFTFFSTHRKRTFFFTHSRKIICLFSDYTYGGESAKSWPPKPQPQALAVVSLFFPSRNPSFSQRLAHDINLKKALRLQSSHGHCFL